MNVQKYKIVTVNCIIILVTVYCIVIIICVAINPSHLVTTHTECNHSIYKEYNYSGLDTLSIKLIYVHKTAFCPSVLSSTILGNFFV